MPKWARGRVRDLLQSPLGHLVPQRLAELYHRPIHPRLNAQRFPITLPVACRVSRFVSRCVSCRVVCGWRTSSQKSQPSNQARWPPRSVSPKMMFSLSSTTRTGTDLQRGAKSRAVRRSDHCPVFHDGPGRRGCWLWVCGVVRNVRRGANGIVVRVEGEGGHPDVVGKISA
jgi:hypothetical protein